MLEIVYSDDVPTGNYYRTGDVEPYVENGDLVLLDGHGPRRYWGTPSTTSTIVFNNSELVAIHIGFFHKFKGGQFWRYFRVVNDRFTQITWANLSDPERSLILGAYQSNAPEWAKIPGKLRSERVKQETGSGYKLVGVRDGKFLSLYDEETEYVIGETKVEKALPDHGGGYYFYKKLEDAENLVESNLASGFNKYAVILVEYGGKLQRYGNRKIAASELTPIKVVETITPFWAREGL